jgi:hypothetical protein
MAEHTHSGSAELGAPMDYREHDRTYDRFLTLTKLTVIGTLNTMIALVLFAFGSAGTGFWLGLILLLMTLVVAGYGLVGSGSMKPSVWVLVIGVLFVILSVG